MSTYEQFQYNRLFRGQQVASWSKNVDFNNPKASFSSGIRNPAVNDKIELLKNLGELIDEYSDFSNLDLATMTGFSVQVQSLRLDRTIDFGNGLDGYGSCIGTKNINTESLCGRTRPDGVNFSVTSLSTTSAVVTPTPNAADLKPGDEILLMCMQGTGGVYPNVGNYEFLRVKSVSGNIIAFTTNKQRFYGQTLTSDANIGTTNSNQRVMIQRVPNYQNLTVEQGATLTCNAYSTTGVGGVIAFRVAGQLNVYGNIDANLKGFAGSYSTDQPEGFAGTASDAYYNGATGTPGHNLTDAGFNKITLGGGGSGAYGSSSSQYGYAGGGIIYIVANTTILNGNLRANSKDATSDPYVRGGGGAGGSIYLKTSSLDLGTHFLQTYGGWPQYVNGRCWVGYKYKSLSAVTYYNTTSTETMVEEFVKNASVQSKNLLATVPQVDSIDTFKYTCSLLPDGCDVKVSFSQDGSTWFGPDGVIGHALDVIVGTDIEVPLTPLLLSGPNFYYKVVMTGDGLQTPSFDAMALVWNPQSVVAGNHTWVSNAYDLGASTPQRVAAVMFKWTDDNELVYPQFQLIGSNTGEFTGEETIFPSPLTYYQKDTANHIENGVLKDTRTLMSTAAFRYWKVKAVINAGSDNAQAATVDAIALYFEPIMQSDFVDDLILDRPFALQSYASSMCQQFGLSQYLFEEFAAPTNIDAAKSNGYVFSRYGVKMNSGLADARVELNATAVDGWDGSPVTSIVGQVFGDGDFGDFVLYYSLDGGTVWTQMNQGVSVSIAPSSVIKLAVVLPTTAARKVRTLHGVALAYDSPPAVSSSTGDPLSSEYLYDRPYIIESYAYTLAQRIGLSQYFVEDFANSTNIDSLASNGVTYNTYNTKINAVSQDARLELYNIAVTGADGFSPITKFFIDLVYDNVDFRIKYSTDGGTVWNDYVKNSIVTPPATFSVKIAVVLQTTASVPLRSLHGIVLLYE